MKKVPRLWLVPTSLLTSDQQETAAKDVKA